MHSINKNIFNETTEINVTSEKQLIKDITNT